MSHDEVDGNGIAGRVGDGAEDVPKRVEADPRPVHAEPLEQRAELRTHVILPQ